MKQILKRFRTAILAGVITYLLINIFSVGLFWVGTGELYLKAFYSLPPLLFRLQIMITIIGVIVGWTVDED